MSLVKALDLGQVLNLNNTTLKSTYVGGTPFYSGYQGCDLSIWCKAAAGVGGSLTQVTFRFETTYNEDDENPNWVPVWTQKAGPAVIYDEHQFSVTAGNSQHDWLFTTNQRLSRFTRVLAKCNTGSFVSGDLAQAWAMIGQG